MKGGEKIESE